MIMDNKEKNKLFNEFAGKNYTSFIVCSKSKILEFAKTFGSNDVNLNINIGKLYINIHVNDMKVSKNTRYNPVYIVDKDLFIICVSTFMERIYMFMCMNDLGKKLNSIMVPFNIGNIRFMSMYASKDKDGEYLSDFGKFNPDKYMNCINKYTFKYRIFNLIFGRIENNEEYSNLRNSFRTYSPRLTKAMINDNLKYAFNSNELRIPFQDMIQKFRDRFKNKFNYIKDNAFRCLTSDEMEKLGIDEERSICDTYIMYKDKNKNDSFEYPGVNRKKPGKNNRYNNKKFKQKSIKK